MTRKIISAIIVGSAIGALARFAMLAKQAGGIDDTPVSGPAIPEIRSVPVQFAIERRFCGGAVSRRGCSVGRPRHR